MADYWSHVSFMLDFDTEEQAQQALELFKEFEEGKHPKYYSYPDWCETRCLISAFDGSPEQLWIRDDESVDIENLSKFLELLVKELNINKPIGVEWANSCSKPRLDAYGGGAFVVCRGKTTLFMNTGEWIDRTVKEISRD